MARSNSKGSFVQNGVDEVDFVISVYNTAFMVGSIMNWFYLFLRWVLILFLLWFLWNFAGSPARAEHISTHIEPPNSLSCSLRTVCAVGGVDWYNKIKSLAYQHPRLRFALLHDHPEVPAQPSPHYYWARNQLAACGSAFFWFSPSMDQWRRGETWGQLFAALEHGQHVVLGVAPGDPDYSRLANWLNEYRHEAVKNNLDDLWLSMGYLDGEFGVRQEFPITNGCEQ